MASSARAMPNSGRVIQSMFQRMARKPGALSADVVARSCHRVRIEGAEAAFAGGEALQRLDQRFAPEIRPQRFDEQQFGIGRLPEQEIGQPVFAAGADHQVRLGQARW